MNPTDTRVMKQVAILLGLIENGDSTRLAGLWQHVLPEHRPLLVTHLHGVAVEALAGLPAGQRTEAADETDALRDAAAAAASDPAHFATSVTAQARHVVDVMAVVIPDKTVRLRQYQAHIK